MRLKSELYAPEQAQIIQKIIDTLELDEENSITLYSLDNDLAKQAKLLALIPTIRRFFSFGHMLGVSEPQKVKRPWLSLIKQVTRTKYEITIRDRQITLEGVGRVRTKRYFFETKEA